MIHNYTTKKEFSKSVERLLGKLIMKNSWFFANISIEKPFQQNFIGETVFPEMFSSFSKNIVCLNSRAGSRLLFQLLIEITITSITYKGSIRSVTPRSCSNFGY